MKTRVRAVIIKGDNILLIHRIKNGNEHWVFPGGGIEESDITPQEGLKRECLEELGIVVDVGDLFAEKSFNSSIWKQTELYYICRIVGGDVGTENGPEFTRDPQVYGTYENEWMPLSALSMKNVQPIEVRDKIIYKVPLMP